MIKILNPFENVMVGPMDPPDMTLEKFRAITRTMVIELETDYSDVDAEHFQQLIRRDLSNGRISDAIEEAVREFGWAIVIQDRLFIKESQMLKDCYWAFQQLHTACEREMWEYADKQVRIIVNKLCHFWAGQRD